MRPSFSSFSDELTKIAAGDSMLFDKLTHLTKFPRPKVLNFHGGGSKAKVVSALASAGLLGLGGAAGAGYLISGKDHKERMETGRSVRKGVAKEHRDPRLYSNLRGVATLEGAKKRVAAHKRLSKRRKDGSPHTIGSAMKAGFTRS